MINVATIKSWVDSAKGNVTKVTDAQGNVLWELQKRMCTVTLITKAAATPSAFVVIDGVKYGSSLSSTKTIEVPSGTVATCTVEPPASGSTTSITVNGQQVVGGTGKYTYNYTITGNVTFNMDTQKRSSSIAIVEED